MLFFNSKQSLDLEGFIDIHTHLLPSVDDGSKSLEATLEILDEYETEGLKGIYFTPHIMVDVPNKSEDLRIKFEQFKSSYKGSLNLSLAAEYMLDPLFMERLENDDLLTIDSSNGKMLLVETTRYDKPHGLSDLLYAIRREGYRPLLAHPERYRYMDIREIKQIKSSETLLQLNLGSLFGAYGEGVQKIALELLNADCYDFVASDIHNKNMLRALKAAKFKKSVIAKIRNIMEKQSFSIL